MSEEKKDLLPCPFCGSSAMLEELGDHHGAYHNLGCSKRECPAHHAIYTESEAPVEDSVNWWNTRAALQESEAVAVAGWVNLSPDTKPEYRIVFIASEQEVAARYHRECYALTPVFTAPPSAQAIETAAIMKCAELMVKRGVLSPDGLNYEALLALLPQDGRTQLEKFGMKVAQEVKSATVYNECRNMLTKENELRAIVTNLIGEKK